MAICRDLLGMNTADIRRLIDERVLFGPADPAGPAPGPTARPDS